MAVDAVPRNGLSDCRSHLAGLLVTGTVAINAALGIEFDPVFLILVCIMTGAAGHLALEEAFACGQKTILVAVHVHPEDTLSRRIDMEIFREFIAHLKAEGGLRFIESSSMTEDA